MRDLPRRHKRIVPVPRVPHGRLGAHAERAQLVERHARARAAQRAPFHLRVIVVARVPLAFEPHVRHALWPKVLLPVLRGRQRDKGAPGGERKLGAAVDRRGGEGEGIWSSTTGSGVVFVLVFSAEVRGEGGQDAEAVVLGGRADGPARDFDRCLRRHVQRVERLATSIDAIMYAERAEAREGHGARREGRREGREAVGEDE